MGQNNKQIKKIVILGGGAAGWLTAGVLAAEHCLPNGAGMDITLVESPVVPTLGVGEGTWPSMRDTLRKIGLSEVDLIRHCDASFKQGSKFIGWRNGAKDDFYYHPFSLPHRYFEANGIAYWLQQSPRPAFAQAVCSQANVCEKHLAPKQESTPEYAAVLNYGYHLDATKFGQLLQSHCTKKLGVKHIVDHVRQVESRADEDISALVTEKNGAVSGDLFIDCSGAAARLLGQHYGIELVPQTQFLGNDRALAVHVPYASDDAPVASATLSTAQASGWVWDIALPTRRGVGYVYSSSHCSETEAEATLQGYLANSVGATIAEQLTPRSLRFTPGHRVLFWHKNCVAVGMAAGFIEPLEASALALVELSAAMIRDDLPADRATMDLVAKRFNNRFHYRWERIVDFLKLHYVLSQRQGSDYWCDHRVPESIPVRLQEQLLLWQSQPPSRLDLIQVEEVFPPASYQYVLYGMGFETARRNYQKRSDNFQFAQQIQTENQQQTIKMLGALPTNRALLDHIRGAN